EGQHGSIKIGLFEYINYLKGGKSSKKIAKIKSKVSKRAPWGPRMDVGGDRAVEYTLWAAFTFLHIIPLYVILVVIFVHSFADAAMAARGTSSNIKTRFGRIVYSSNLSRAWANIIKFLGFGYLILMYTLGYPALFGYILVALLVSTITIRGASEIYESITSM
ncbi:hypothetical protein B1B_17854, partial [mine drainage metagenome]